MNKTNKKPHIMLFFSYGMSLQAWAESGLIGRELLLYKKMIKQGYNVSFLTYGDATDYRYSDQLGGINIIPVFSIIKKNKNKWINLLKSFFIPCNLKIKKIISAADIYKTNQMMGSWVPLLAGIMYKKPLVVRCGYEMLRNLLRDEKNPFTWLIKAIFGYSLELMAYVSADRIIISNKSDKQYIKKLFPIKNEKLFLIRNFIDTDHFSDNHSNPIDRNNRKALFIGRIEQRKNIENLIYGSVVANCALDIIGNGKNKAYFMKIAEQQKGNIDFIGVFDNSELPDIIRKYTLFILPSFYENNPKTILEAMACARVVLGTDVDGIRELIDDQNTGFLCNTDVLSIKNAIITIFNTPCEKLNIVAENARQFVLKECAIERVFQQEMDIYSQLLNRPFL